MRMRRICRGWLCGIVVGFVALGIGAFVGVPGVAAEQDDSHLPLALADSPETVVPEAAAPEKPEEVARVAAAETPEDLSEAELAKREIAGKDEQIEEYDPWEPFNDKTFSFNRQFDRFLLKPVATVWDVVVPDPVQEGLKNALTNVGVARRVVNNILQLNFEGAGREVARFVINSTLGVAGFFDVAKSAFGIEKSDRDTGQTLGVWGVEQGPYLVLPFLPPLTIRDGIGFVADVALDPLVYFAPFAALAGRTGATVVNDRSINLELYESVQETTLDLYSAVRNAYLQRRAKAVKEAVPSEQKPSPGELRIELHPSAD